MVRARGKGNSYIVSKGDSAELSRHFSNIESRLSKLEGLDGDINLRGARVRNAKLGSLWDEGSDPMPGIRRDTATGVWEYSEDGITWYPFTTPGLIDRLTSQVGWHSQLIFSDNFFESRLENTFGDLTIEAQGGDVYFEDGVGGEANVHGRFYLEPTRTVCQFVAPLGANYRNVNLVYAGNANTARLITIVLQFQ